MLVDYCCLRRAMVAVVTAAIVVLCAPNAAHAQVIRGACCFANGTCTVYRSSVCANRSGIWRGANTSCTPNVCPQPRGGCCFTDGACAYVARAGCVSLRGTYQGNGTTCGVRTCPRPPAPTGGNGGGGGGQAPAPPVPQIGACCLPDLTCIETTAADCTKWKLSGAGAAVFSGVLPGRVATGGVLLRGWFVRDDDGD